MDPTLTRLIGKRLLAIPLSLLVVASFAFGLVALIPGDPAVQILGQFATPDELDRLRRELGLHGTFVERYAGFMGQLARGDLGTSFQSRRPVVDEIGRYLPATVELVVLSTLGAVLIGLVMGGIGAWFRGRWPDRISSGGVTLFQSIPDFLLALLLIFALFFVLRLVPPPVGRLGFGAAAPPAITGMLLVDTLVAGDFASFRRAAAASVLPVLALSIVYSAYIGKISRTTIAAALNSDQALYARGCGLSDWQVFRYALLQARTPILTYGAILFGSLIGGAAIVETIFAWRGVGEWALKSMLTLDVPAIQGFVIVAGAITLFLYLALDILVLLLDPRIRLQ
jgi:ABC-type dipeptide/oligopeptide/nickel transport system permease component